MELENKLITISKKILNDFGREFFENTFKFFSPQELKERGTYKYNYDVWEVFVNVPDEQFGGQSPFSICFKEETMEPFMFHDFGAPGRTPYLTVIKKNGKYVIGDVWRNE
jgi:hypothetical protein